MQDRLGGVSDSNRPNQSAAYAIATRRVSEGRAIGQNPSLTRRVVIEATSRHVSG